jgi:glycosidase
MDTWQYVPNSFWTKWTAAIKKEHPTFTVVGEVKDGDVVHVSYFQGGTVRDGSDPGLDSLLDFPLFYPIRHAFAEGKRLDEIPKTLAKDYLYSDSEILMTLLGGHDDGRFMSEHGATLDGLKLANAFVLTTRGVPQLYYGDEIAMTGPDEPTTRADFPGGFAGDSRSAFTREGRTPQEQDLFQFVQKMIRLHTTLEPLKRGKLINLYVSEQQYAFARKSTQGAVIVVFNNDTKATSIDFSVNELGMKDEIRVVDQLEASYAVGIKNGRLTVSLAPRSVRVLMSK